MIPALVEVARLGRSVTAEMRDPSLESVTFSTGAPAFSTGPGGRIAAINAAAAELLGVDAAVVGRPCHDVIAARDIFGNLLCHENCAFRGMAEQQEAIRPFLMTGAGRRAAGPISCTVLVLRNPAGPGLVHLLRDERPAPPGDGDAAEDRREPTDAPSVTADARAFGLSPRELDTLRLLALRRSPKEIAAAFGISIATSRNHVQRVLRKLSVHSQAEAVAFALRHRLV